MRLTDLTSPRHLLTSISVAINNNIIAHQNLVDSWVFFHYHFIPSYITHLFTYNAVIKCGMDKFYFITNMHTLFLSADQSTSSLFPLAITLVKMG